MRSLHSLRVRDAPATGPLHLLRRNENALTFALGHALQQVPVLLTAFFERFALPPRNLRTTLHIVLQERVDLGITDIEILNPNGTLHVVIEAKLGGWPELPGP